MFSKYVGSWLSDGNKRSSLSKYSCLELLISLTTLFRATLFPLKVIFFGLSEDASAFPYLTYDKACTCNPCIIIGFYSYNFNLDRFHSSQDYGISNVLNILVYIVIRLNYVF